MSPKSETVLVRQERIQDFPMELSPFGPDEERSDSGPMVTFGTAAQPSAQR